MEEWMKEEHSPADAGVNELKKTARGADGGNPKTANQISRYASYDEVVFYRKAWVWGLLLVFLTPVAVLIGLTGDVYRLQDGQMTTAPRPLILTASIGFGLLALLKIFGPMFIHP